MEYMFSIVMAVYNVEQYMREAVDSLIGQTIGFEHIQLILIDDGSTDSSGMICDEYAVKYPDNILVVHKENGGLSSARNAGLEHARGAYINFMDSDDVLSPDSLSCVWQFFEKHHDETDYVSIPIIYFEAKSGDHQLNYKFQNGARVVDLNQEWSIVHLHVASTFIRREAIGDLRFDVDLRYAEDCKYMLQLYIRKPYLGVVPQARYMYRQRLSGELSELEKAARDPARYMARIRYLSQTIIEQYLQEIGSVPKFVQFALMYDLQWTLRIPVFPSVFSESEKEQYIKLLRSVLSYIDDDVLLKENIAIEHKLHALALKHDRAPELLPRSGDLDIYCNGQKIYSISQRKPIIEFISFENNTCSVEGYVSLFPFRGTEWEITAEVDGKPVACEAKLDDRTVSSLGEVILSFYRFHVLVPLTLVGKGSHLKVGVRANGNVIRFNGYRYGYFSGLSEHYRYSYHKCGRWCVRNGADIAISKASWYTGFVNESLFLVNLLFSRKYRARKAVLYRLAYRFLRLVKRRPLWLISDREGRAGDNGEEFFRYITANHPEIDARFLLLRESVDFPRLDKIGRVVPADSRKRKLLALVCDYAISSQVERLNIRPFAPKDEPYRDIMAEKRYVFLQHGITKDDVSDWLKKSHKNFYGLITAARPEYEAFLSEKYGYTPKEIWLTGFPRFDRLVSDDDPKQITVMPTWRKYLMGEMDPRTAIWSMRNTFITSSYLSFYNSLLNDPRLLQAAEDYGYKMAFLPHPNLQPYKSVFKQNEKVAFLGPETAYPDVYAASALVVTDYSSAVFDFAYMRRPVIYAQFDHDEFFSGGHVFTEGYFDYERDGFGEVETHLEGTVDRIIEYMENGCRMKEKYRERADRFFAFSDRNNCRRVYEKLIDSGKTDKQ